MVRLDRTLVMYDETEKSIRRIFVDYEFITQLDIDMITSYFSLFQNNIDYKRMVVRGKTLSTRYTQRGIERQILVRPEYRNSYNKFTIVFEDTEKNNLVLNFKDETNKWGKFL